MAIMNIDHQEIRRIADEADEYCNKQDTEVARAYTAVISLLIEGWKGKDADAFRNKWIEINVDDSVHNSFKKSVADYAERLRKCADKYQEAQADSYNEAQKLP